MSTDLPILQSMLQKLLAKGLPVKVVETHQVWCGTVTACDVGRSVEGAIEVVIERADGKKGSFNILQPERWKLGKSETGEWTLWPPRARSRKT